MFQNCDSCHSLNLRGGLGDADVFSESEADYCRRNIAAGFQPNGVDLPLHCAQYASQPAPLIAEPIFTNEPATYMPVRPTMPSGPSAEELAQAAEQSRRLWEEQRRILAQNQASIERMRSYQEGGAVAIRDGVAVTLEPAITRAPAPAPAPVPLPPGVIRPGGGGGGGNSASNAITPAPGPVIFEGEPGVVAPVWWRDGEGAPAVPVAAGGGIGGLLTLALLGVTLLNQ